MATPSDEDVEILTMLIGGDEFDHDTIVAVLEREGDVNLAAAYFWEVRAGRYHALVDISESGSSRKMSDLYANALKMAAYFRAKFKDDIQDPGEEDPRGRTRTGQIVRL